MNKLLTLAEWAARRYETPPSTKTLHRWRRDGRIYPEPRKEGRQYVVPANAQYIDCADPESISRAASALGESQEAQLG